LYRYWNLNARRRRVATIGIVKVLLRDDKLEKM